MLLLELGELVAPGGLFTRGKFMSVPATVMLRVHELPEPVVGPAFKIRYQRNIDRVPLKPEALGLNVGDATALRTSLSLTVAGKGSKARIVPVLPAVREAIEAEREAAG